MKTYTTLAELAAAYKAGEIKCFDGTVPPLILDNDCSTVHVYVDSDDDDEWEPVFRSDYPPDAPGGILEQALDLLGIPHEGA